MFVTVVYIPWNILPALFVLNSHHKVFKALESHHESGDRLVNTSQSTFINNSGFHLHSENDVNETNTQQLSLEQIEQDGLSSGQSKRESARSLGMQHSLNLQATAQGC